MKENHLLNSEIPLDLYRIFYYVAEELSFSKAAARLYVSQSAVSQAIASLENQLATVLFHRSTKKVSLSQEGITLFSYLEPAFHLIDSA
ncbi:MAG: LysR family transcriptional regulator, partial [Vallitaleaceae bacterium]|nr:LysR family transcriptional regulator [Vallitaleaceae bacterium]